MGVSYSVVGVATPLRVERKRDHGGLGPKSKRRREKTENRSKQRTDYAENRLRTGHGPTNSENANRNDTDRNNNEYVLMDANNYQSKILQPTVGHENRY